MVKIEEIMDWLELMNNITAKQHWDMDRDMFRIADEDVHPMQQYMRGYLLGSHNVYSTVLSMMTAYMIERAQPTGEENDMG